ncbi:MAG TPA: peptide-methionine (S)-S-oxide reductase MsrA [Vicinamibacteria bacterium]|nr:peptide-methionine (S)-S-oxide reductase MsrA [Vicinamibacteria bacterium]
MRVFAVLVLALGTLPLSGAELEKATFAGGCFWCMEPPFDALEGVISTTSGYIGGRVENPSYEQVSYGGTGHLEAVEILYDPKKVSYEKLLEVFWVNVNPTDGAGQFCDRGSQYATAIFFHDEEQRRLAEESKREIEESGRLDKKIVTPIREATAFYRAEEYHQDYYTKNPFRYKLYRAGCGRDRILRQLWGDEATH